MKNVGLFAQFINIMMNTFMCSNFCPSSIAGHLGSVNDVDFHRVEPIILSASSDKQIYLGEFDDE